MTNEAHKVVANLLFHENCHYKESQWQSEIEIPKQATITEIIDITNINAPDRIDAYKNNGKNYFNDKVQITIQITNAHTHQPITYGKVNVYFKEINKEIVNLTPQSIDVSDDGLVQIIHQPHNNGYYYAEYISDDDNEYYLPSTSNNVDIVFETIPVVMQLFIDKSFPHPEESVNLSATVKNVYNNNINYGTVTFYTERTNDIDDSHDGYENVIGDPIPVNNGFVEINYAPIQLASNQLRFYYNNLTGNLIYTYDDENDFRTVYVTEDNHDQYPDANIGDIIYIYNDEEEYNIDYINSNDIEYIYAHFNYKNKIYSNGFKYYSSHRCKSTLNVLSPDNIHINIGVNNNNQFENIYDDYSKYDGCLHIPYNKSLILQSTITDVFNEPITDFTSDNTITFYIHGTTMHENNENLDINDLLKKYDFNEITQEVIGRYNEDKEIFECIMDTPLEPGYYTIYGHFNGSNLFDENDTVTLYLCVEDATTNLNITFTATDLITSNISRITTQDVLGVITQNSPNPLPDDIWQTLLNNKECYLYLNDIKYKCQMHYNNDNDNYTINLVKDIIFQQPNNYATRITLPGGKYNNILLPTCNSNTVLIRVRLDLNPYIKSLSVTKQSYPGTIQGILSVENVFDETPQVTITIDNNGQTISQNYIYTGNDINFTFDNLDASINQHIIYARINNNISPEQTFVINRANLTTYLDADYRTAKCSSKNKSTIITGLNRNISFIVDSDGEDFTNYNINNIDSINLALCNSEDYIHPTPTITKINNNTQLQVTYQQTLPTPNDWKTGIIFNGDNNYNGPSTEYFSFRTKTIAPLILYSRNDDNKTLHVYITDNDGNDINQYILLEIDIQDIENNLHHVNIITETNGQAIIDCSDMFESDIQWQDIQKIIFKTNPFNETNIQLIKDENDKINKFKQLYPNLQCGTNDIDINIYVSGIINQLIANDYQCFYTTYSNAISTQLFQMINEDVDIPSSTDILDD